MVTKAKAASQIHKTQMKLHHIGIACKNIQKEKEKISQLHQVVSSTEIIFDPLQNAQLCMLSLADGTNLELVAGEAVKGFVSKRMSYYHLCYEVANIEQSIEELTQKGAFLISPAQPAILFGGRKVAFLMFSYGIVELLNQD
jgi:methylmalonyl-CoA/ethylmalonyl-CoA epimerase